MPHIRAQCVFPTVTNLPRDRVTNTWHFDNANGDLDFFEASTLIGGLLDTSFYRPLWLTPYQPANWMKPNLGWWINFYDMTEPEPRVPFRVDVNGANYSGSTSVIPAEVATCLSFQGAPVSGQSQARRRGRLYLPGMNAAMLEQESAGLYPTLNDDWITRVVTRAGIFAGDVADNTIAWSVYSTVAGTLAHVTNGWVDEAPDTQRRRGQDSQARVTWTVV